MPESIQPPGRIKALTLYQPWASLIAYGWKEYETRSWAPKVQPPFLLGIHAGQHSTAHPVGYQEMDRLFASVCRDYAHLPRRAMVAIAMVTEIRFTPSNPDLPELEWVKALSDREKLFGDFGPGRFCWKLEDVQRLDPPLPVSGQRGLWEWPLPALVKVRKP